MRSILSKALAVALAAGLLGGGAAWAARERRMPS